MGGGTFEMAIFNPKKRVDNGDDILDFTSLSSDIYVTEFFFITKPSDSVAG